LATLSRLRDLGNTVIVVEHDEETIRTADYVIDLGPGAGEHGGHVIFQGTPADLLESARIRAGVSIGQEVAESPERDTGLFSLTGAYLIGARMIPTPKGRRP